MSGIVNSAGSKSGVIERKETSAIRYRLASGSTGAQDPLDGWELSLPVEFSVGYTYSSTLVTHSSGVFTFGQTGYYSISSIITGQQQTNDATWAKISHEMTDSSGVDWGAVTFNYTALALNAYSSISNTSLVKVEDLAVDKFKITSVSEDVTTYWQFEGTGAAPTQSYIDFIRLGGL